MIRYRQQYSVMVVMLLPIRYLSSAIYPQQMFCWHSLYRSE